MRLFVDISSHGFGHLSIAAPVLNALARQAPDLHLVLRTLVPERKLQQRIEAPFQLIPERSDFGYVMQDALRIDRTASAKAYRDAYRDRARRVEEEAALLRSLAPDLVLSNISDLPLAGAHRAGIPAAALCSLNWADLFAHYYGNEAWATPIHETMLEAYRSAEVFLRPTPGMPMPALDRVVPVAPIAARGERRNLGLPEGERAVMLAMGGIAMRLPVEDWPRLPGVRWLLPAEWQCRHPDAIAMESFQCSFTDLLASVDAVVTKPGYGTFTEAACNGTPVLYQVREDWPEQHCLIAWLHEHARCAEIAEADMRSGRLAGALDALWSQPERPLPQPCGGEEAAAHLLKMLRRSH